MSHTCVAPILCFTNNIFQPYHVLAILCFTYTVCHDTILLIPYFTHLCQVSCVSAVLCVSYPVCHLYNINLYYMLSPTTTFSIPPISSYTIDHSLLYISLYHILSYSVYHPILHIAPYYISPPICISCIIYCIQYLILLNICSYIHTVYHFYPHITY